MVNLMITIHTKQTLTGKITQLLTITLYKLRLIKGDTAFEICKGTYRWRIDNGEWKRFN